MRPLYGQKRTVTKGLKLARNEYLVTANRARPSEQGERFEPFTSWR